MTQFPELKIVETRRINENTQNLYPLAFDLSTPDPLVRFFIMKVLEDQIPSSIDYNASFKSGALLDTNNEKLLRVTFKKDPSFLVDHLKNDYERWYNLQDKMGRIPGIIESVEKKFKKRTLRP